jgi:hypothetical protein
VTNTPGVVWESKTAREFRPAAFVKQARAAAQIAPAPALPVVVYFPDGCGEKAVDAALAILPLGRLMQLLEAGEYTP